MRRLAPILLALLAAGCGSRANAPSHVAGTAVERCRPGTVRPLGSSRLAYAGIAEHGAVAYARQGGGVAVRFGPENVNGYPTVFEVTASVLDARCRATWFRVQLPLRPNGSTGYVRAHRVQLARVETRIVVDVSSRRLTVFRRGRRVLSATVAVGAPATPTPLGRYYVNQRLIPRDAGGPYGPAAIGISAFSNVLTGWAQGGPVAIHGTNEPWSIGQAVSNGCIRLPNATLERIYPLAVAGTPVIIHG